VHEAALAVQRLAPDHFWSFSAVLFEHQANYFDEKVVNEPRNATYARLAKLAAGAVPGLNDHEIYKLLEIKEAGAEGPKNQGNAVTNDVKTIVKMARLVGVHVTPTVVFNGVVAGEISSSWTEEQWAEWLEKNIV
jgi:protein-disulfide isomerase